MKKLLLLSFCFATLCAITSCSDDDEPTVNPLVGEWILDKITVSDPPAGHQLATTPNPTSLYGESSYELEFFEDMTFERTLRSSADRIDEDGEWELDEADLDLDIDNSNAAFTIPTRFTVEGEITDRDLVLVTTDSWLAWPPSIVEDEFALDTADTQEKLNELFNEYGVVVDFTFTLEFEKD
ncbi:MAG: hypothetical protein KI790_02845 [Cyclobacteriaceae bacterium]|nr:hypothetical protein [Cyclobacteriaceae bacterium HetDA_MAG_MS6]